MTKDLTTKKSSLKKSFSLNLIFSGVIGLLILVVLMQIFLLQQVKAYAKGFIIAAQSNQAKSSNSQTKTPTGSADSSDPGGIPAQVGGC